MPDPDRLARPQVGDGCEPREVPDPHDDQWRGRSRRIGHGSDRLRQNGFYGIDWLSDYAADVDLELQSLRAQLAAALGDMEHWRDLFAAARGDWQDQAERLETRLAAALAVVEAARLASAEFRGVPVDELGLAVRLTRLFRALDHLPRPTEE